MCLEVKNRLELAGHINANEMTKGSLLEIKHVWLFRGLHNEKDMTIMKILRLLLGLKL